MTQPYCFSEVYFTHCCIASGGTEYPSLISVLAVSQGIASEHRLQTTLPVLSTQAEGRTRERELSCSRSPVRDGNPLGTITCEQLLCICEDRNDVENQGTAEACPSSFPPYPCYILQNQTWSISHTV